MKVILFAAAILAGATGAALAGEGNGEPFPQALSGISQTYVTGSAPAPARPAAAVPAYARLLPGNASMAARETPNSLPPSLPARRAGQGPNS